MDARIITSLTEHISGHVFTGSDASNTIRTGLWNGFDEVIVPVVVECSDSDDIQAAVRIAAEYNLPVSVLGGGHDWYRRSVSRSGITLDLRQMRQVTVSSDRATLIADGGAVVKNAVDALPDNYALVTGVHSQVGLAGLALGGGYGKLNSRFGLVTDNLKSATFVLADGALVTVSEDENADLFWALRGAGKNFGVLCSAEFIIHKLSPVLTATIFIAPPDARKGLCNLQDILDSADDRLSVFSTFSSLPGKGPGLILEPMWSGDEATGERYLQQLSSLAGACVIKKHGRNTGRPMTARPIALPGQKVRDTGWTHSILSSLTGILLRASLNAAAQCPLSKAVSCCMIFGGKPQGWSRDTAPLLSVTIISICRLWLAGKPARRKSWQTNGCPEFSTS